MSAASACRAWLQASDNNATLQHIGPAPLISPGNHTTGQAGFIRPLSITSQHVSCIAEAALESLASTLSSFDRNGCRPGIIIRQPALAGSPRVWFNLQTELFASQTIWHDVLWKCLGCFLLHVRCYPLSWRLFAMLSSCCKQCFKMNNDMEWLCVWAECVQSWFHGTFISSRLFLGSCWIKLLGLSRTKFLSKSLTF